MIAFCIQNKAKYMLKNTGENRENLVSGGAKSGKQIKINSIILERIPRICNAVGISRRDGKCPDGMTQIPWHAGKLLVWGVTVVVSTLAQSYVAAAAHGRAEVAELGAVRKCEKYAKLSTAYTFLPIAVETLGPMNESAYHFFEDLDRRICDVTGNTRGVSFIFQSPFNASVQLSIARRSFCTTIWTSSHSTFAFSVFLFLTPRIFTTRGKK